LTGNVLSILCVRIDKTLPVKRAKNFVNFHQNLNHLCSRFSVLWVLRKLLRKLYHANLHQLRFIFTK
jgi:hypothetical protein